MWESCLTFLFRTMGIFSRKPKLSGTKSNGKPFDTASMDSESSSSKLPTSAGGGSTGGISRLIGNRASSGSVPPTPMSPMSPMSPMASSHLSVRINLPKPPDPTLDAAGYLRSLGAVRERCKIVTDKALQNKLNHFDVDLTKFPDVVSFVCQIIKVRYISKLYFKFEFA